MIKGWRGFNFDIDFNDGMNILIGMNGCGKTTILDLISGLTGPACAADLLTGTFEFIRLDVSWEASTFVGRHETIMMEGSFDFREISFFKRKLPVRSSYVLRHDLYDNRYLGAVHDRESNIRDTLESLRAYDMDLRRQLQVSPNRASYMISETGGQRFLLTVGMRLSPPGVPMLVDMPERSLHVMIRRTIHGFYANHDQQVIYATHCPEMVASVTRYYKRIDVTDWHNQSPDDRPEHGCLFDLHSSKNTTIRKDYMDHP